MNANNVAYVAHTIKGIHCKNAEEIAAKYAADETFDTEYRDNATIECQLDELLDEGAEFDYDKAFALAKERVTAFIDEHEKDLWAHSRHEGFVLIGEVE